MLRNSRALSGRPILNCRRRYASLRSAGGIRAATASLASTANGTMRNAFTLYVTHPDVELRPGVALLGSFAVPGDR